MPLRLLRVSSESLSLLEYLPRHFNNVLVAPPLRDGRTLDCFICVAALDLTQFVDAGSFRLGRE